jgi:hypothetical protein
MARIKRLSEPTRLQGLFKPVYDYLNALLRDLKFNIEALNYELTKDVYEDLRFSATVINPPGAVSDPDWDNTNGGWLFDSSSTEVLFTMAQLPHSWKESSDLQPHVHWQKTTSASGNVVWQLDYKWAPIGEAMDSSFTTLSSSTSVTTDNDTADEHLITSFGEISAEGKQISDMLVMKLSRIGGDGDDTYGADVRLLEFDIHYKVNSRGSNFLYEK